MKQLTFQDILDMKPCSRHLPDKYIPKTWKGTILDILRLPNVAPAEKLWVAYRVLDDGVLRLFAVACARRALSKIENPDNRSTKAVEVAEAFAHGRASKEELAAAYVAADASAAEATYASAAEAVYASAVYAAEAAYASAAYAAAEAAYASAAYAAADASARAYASAARKKERAQQIEDLIKLVKK